MPVHVFSLLSLDRSASSDQLGLKSCTDGNTKALSAAVTLRGKAVNLAFCFHPQAYREVQAEKFSSPSTRETSKCPTHHMIYKRTTEEFGSVQVTAIKYVKQLTRNDKQAVEQEPAQD